MDSEPLPLFVYGTLKKGFPAHDRFFREGIKIEEAVVRGSLFDLPAGYPALAVPEDGILAAGTANPRHGIAEGRSKNLPAKHKPPDADETVRGEVVRLADPGNTLPALDAFEGFDPDGASLYLRVLVPAWTNSGTVFPVWTYVMESPLGTRLPGGRWPPSGKEPL